ncbi:MAG: transcriptional regulator, LysR family [Rhodospirillales bacterium]|jgi:DNA-binding transcriptional LysR family regulator|nr:transcriptional regulator, LysR family [Rhodospirillales bacterium]
MPAKLKVTDTSAQLCDLRAFCLAVDLGSITAAARRTGVSKATLSRRITRLERALGAVLVRRSPRIVQATEFGAAYKSQIQNALDLLDQASDSVEAEAHPRGNLRLTAPPGTGISVLAPLLLRFSEQFPDIRIELILAEPPIDFDALGIDVAIQPALKLRDSSLIAHKLLNFELALVASPDYLAKRGAPKTVAELQQHKVLSRAMHQLIRLSARAGRSKSARVKEFNLHSPIITTDNAFIREAALAGGGIALLSTNLCDADVAAGRLVRVMANHKIIGNDGSIYLLHHAMRFLPPKVKVFRDFMIEHFSDRPRRAG